MPSICLTGWPSSPFHMSSEIRGELGDKYDNILVTDNRRRQCIGRVQKDSKTMIKKTIPYEILRIIMRKESFFTDCIVKHYWDVVRLWWKWNSLIINLDGLSIGEENSTNVIR